MIKKLGWCVWLACLGVLGGTDPAYAQRTAPVFSSGAATPRHTVNFTIGRYSLFGTDSRVDGDVFVEMGTFLASKDRSDPAADLLEPLEPSDFAGWTYGVEYLAAIGNHFEAGAGLSFYQRSVDVIYQGQIDDDGTEIDSTLRLRQMPLAFTVRAVPFGQDSPVQPYVGGGVVVTRWNYLESGEFVGEDDQIFVGDFEAQDWSIGWQLLGGVRFIAGRTAIGGEFRYTKAEGDLPAEFFGSKIDLGGWTLQGTIGVRF